METANASLKKSLSILTPSKKSLTLQKPTSEKENLLRRLASYNAAIQQNVNADKKGPTGCCRGKCGVYRLFVVWDSNYSKRIFGSRNAIEKEEARRQELPFFVIHPCSKFRIYWDSILLFILMLNVILLPVAIAFFHSPSENWWLVFHVISDFIFVVDIVMNFWTGIITDDNNVILELKKLRRIYAKHWLVVDIVSLLPFDYVTYFLFTFSGASPTLYQSTMALRLLRPLTKLLSLVKLLRLVKFMHALPRWEETVNSSAWSTTRILNFIMGMLLLCHWNGCIQFLFAFLQGFPPTSWVAINNLENASVGTQYSWALFKAMSHMLCIGYGQFPPKNTVEVWTTIVSMIIGATLYAMFIGHITNLIYSSTSSTRLYSEKLKLVEEYMRYHKIPRELKIKVRNYFFHRYHGRLFNEKTMLKELSHVLEEEITKFNYKDVIKNVTIFKNVDDGFLTAIASMLTFEVFLEGDFIINTDVMGSTMYFIHHGEAEVINCKGEPIRTLIDGDYFGEIGLLMNEQRQGSVKATTVCFVFCLERDDLNTVLNQFPSLRASLEARARERLQELYLSEDRPLETILALFSDHDLDDESVMRSGSEESGTIITKGDEESINTVIKFGNVSKPPSESSMLVDEILDIDQNGETWKRSNN